MFRRELRLTLGTYQARLESELAEIRAAVSGRPGQQLSRERLHGLRELLIMLRKRKLKPERARRKDVRKLENLIRDMLSIVHSNPSPPN